MLYETIGLPEGGWGRPRGPVGRILVLVWKGFQTRNLENWIPLSILLLLSGRTLGKILYLFESLFYKMGYDYLAQKAVMQIKCKFPNFSSFFIPLGELVPAFWAFSLYPV